MTRRLSTRLGLFTTFCLCVILLNLDVVRALVLLSRADETASHLILIPFVSIALISLNWRDIFTSESSTSARPAVLPGAVLMAVGLAVLAGERAFGHLATGDSLSVLMTGLVITVISGFLLFFGAPAFRAASFPLLFLLFAIPIPSGALATAVELLKGGSAQIVAWLFQLTGTPYHREGFAFSLPHFVIQIADECSGIRSSIALLLTSLLAGYVFLRTAWKRVLLAAIVVPFAIIKNGIRIVTLSLLAEHVDVSYLTGRLHHEGGIVFFLLTLALLFPVFVMAFRSDLRRAL